MRSERSQQDEPPRQEEDRHEQQCFRRRSDSAPGNGGRSGVESSPWPSAPRRMVQSGAVLPGLPGGLSLLSGHRAGLDGAVAGLSPHGRKLGFSDPADPGSRHENPAAVGPVLPADRVGDPLSLPLAQPDLVAASAKLQYQQFYLAPTYFWIRAAVYFALWTAIAYLLASWSRKEDQTGDPRLAWKSLKLSGYAAVVYGISLHFAAIDWAMSLQPVFHSTIWGPLFATGQLLSALAFALVVLPSWSTGRLWPRWFR